MNMYQKFRKVLYHGTVSEIVKVDVTRGREKLLEEAEIKIQ